VFYDVSNLPGSDVLGTGSFGAAVSNTAVVFLSSRPPPVGAGSIPLAAAPPDLGSGTSTAAPTAAAWVPSRLRLRACLASVQLECERLVNSFRWVGRAGALAAGGGSGAAWGLPPGPLPVCWAAGKP
jgi:hypothetical protein